MNTATVLQRIEQLITMQKPTSGGDLYSAGFAERKLGTLTLMTAVYGSGSPQQEQLNSGAWTWAGMEGLLRAMKADVDAGLLGTLERRGAGDVLGDMLQLAREAMAAQSDAAKNVTAVLAAAAFEDTIRKMGESMAGVKGRSDLADVITH